MIDSSDEAKSSPIFPIRADNPEMEQAIKRARASFKFFWRELSWEYRRIIPALNLACVKAAFKVDDRQDDQPESEHMWLNEIMFNGYKIQGTLINEPSWVTSVAAGDAVTLKLNEVEDWMYAYDENVFGAFTVNVIRKTMGAGERRQHDQAWGLNFGDPTAYRIADYSSPKKKGFLSSMFGGRPQAMTMKELEQLEHPMSINMGDSLKEAITNNKKFLTTTDDTGNSTLHSEAIAGNLTSVNVLLECGANRQLKNKHGHTPRDLAERLKWPLVIQALS